MTFDFLQIDLGGEIQLCDLSDSGGKLFTINYSLFTIHYSLFTIHYKLFTIHYSLFTIHYSL
jgi:hypothetical protein